MSGRKRIVKVGRAGRRAEKQGVDWLEDHHFEIIKRFPGAHADHFDVVAKKSGKKWMIEIKSGRKPSVRIDSLLEMLSTSGCLLYTSDAADE